ncbi:single-stranded DNA-binding protein [Chakrabartyella piscis]|uniref:single-stranded DNA-binding protein n=1 Tax=Chakrabartyella piscis TaxID=2918914 RepID=UPI002958CEED|nr:single-stranded DNA-binding protein [Chakrabartyella piscis]
MNKVILMGRLTRDPEVRYSQGATPMAVARYSIAVNRRFKRDETDFINCVAFGKTGEFAEKYLKKGQMITIVGSLRTGSYDDKDGKKVRTTDVVVDEHYFAESKASYESNRSSAPAPAKQPAQADGFYPIDESMEDDDLPF